MHPNHRTPGVLIFITGIGFILAGCQNKSTFVLSNQEKQKRIKLDFTKTETQVRKSLEKYYPVLPDSLIKAWEESGALEMRMIDGEKRYFKYAVNNLFRIDPEARKVKEKLSGPPDRTLDSIRLANSAEIIHAGKPGHPAVSKTYRIEYTITVNADAVPDGETIRCWMPYPRLSPPRQTRITLIWSDPVKCLVSNQETFHASLYGEKKAISGQPATFSYIVVFSNAGQWIEMEPIRPNPYIKESEEYLDNTGERPPHIVFSEPVKRLADSLAGNEREPFKIVHSFYSWIDQNIPWASALEYSVFECIPDYVLGYRHGDCGMVTFLFMSMARYKGIPVRWQSGWMLHPGEENLHDWCEVYYAGTGWVPLDMSFGFQKTDDPVLRGFYMNGIDSYRLIVNDDFAGEFNPPKKHVRSEPYDFQRGEVEWKGGNLYFNQWDYQLNIISIEDTD